PALSIGIFSPCALAQAIASGYPASACRTTPSHSTLRNALIPTPRQQGMDGEATQTDTPYWQWARLRGRVFGLARAPCPLCRRGALRIMAALTQESMLTRLLRHRKRASVPPPMAPARCRQELCAFD